jgi:hypothetical protein
VSKRKTLSSAEASALLDQLLDTPFWPASLNASEAYHTKSDDNPRDEASHLSVVFSPDGDAWVEVQSFIDPDADIYTATHRFRTYLGGGRRLHIRNALLFLARAIQLDREAT